MDARDARTAHGPGSCAEGLSALSRDQSHRVDSASTDAYCAPAIIWEQEFVALATCSVNPCLCVPPPPECRGG